MPNEENLKPIQSTEEARERGRAGGIASGAARRRKRSLKEAADLYLSLPVSDRRRWNKIARRGVDPEDADNQMAMVIGLADAATAGDARAAKVLVDLLGEAEEQRARVDNLKASTAKLRGDDPDGEIEDDGFLDALKGRATEVWEE